MNLFKNINPMKQKIKNEIIKILNDCEYWQPKMIIEEKEPFFWEINHDWLEDKSNRLSELFEKQKQEIVEEIEEEIKQTRSDLARSKQWIDEVKVKYQQYSKMFDDFKASDDGEMSAALEQYNLESGYLNALNYLKQKLTK